MAAKLRRDQRALPGIRGLGFETICVTVVCWDCGEQYGAFVPYCGGAAVREPYYICSYCRSSAIVGEPVVIGRSPVEALGV